MSALTTLAGHITRYNGKRIDGYTSSGGQCIDQVRRRIEERTGNGYHGIPGVGSAKDFWNAVDLRKWSKHGRSSGFIPLRDALLVMRAFGDNPHGHVAIVRDGSTKNTIYTFDQNWSLKRLCARERHAVDSRVLGYLVLKR